MMTRSAFCPLVIKVLAPLTTKWSPASTAEVRMPAMSDPAPGSVMPMAAISSPLTKPGSQRSCCSEVVSSAR